MAEGEFSAGYLMLHTLDSQLRQQANGERLQHATETTGRVDCRARGVRGSVELFHHGHLLMHNRVPNTQQATHSVRVCYYSRHALGFQQTTCSPCIKTVVTVRLAFWPAAGSAMLRTMSFAVLPIACLSTTKTLPSLQQRITNPEKAARPQCRHCELEM